MSIKRDRGEGVYSYRCQGRSADRYGCPAFTITTRILDESVWARVVEVLRDPRIIAGEVARLGDDQTASSNVEALARRISELVRRQARVARLVSTMDDDEAAAPLAHELKSLAGQKRQLEAERVRLVERAEDAAGAAHRLADLAAWCARVAENLTLLGYEEKRRVLEALAVDVRVWRADHEPRWQLTMSVPDHHPEVLTIGQADTGMSDTLARVDNRGGPSNAEGSESVLPIVPVDLSVSAAD